MDRKIIGFDQDNEGHWRAKLECRHYQHVRHDPPLRSREWVLTDEGRQVHIGLTLSCIKCDESRPKDFESY